MAIKFNRSQTFATGGTVTSAALHNLVDGTDIYAALITDQTPLTTVSTADKLLIADTDDSVNAKSVTVQELFDDALSAGTYTNANLTGQLSYGTATGNRTVSTSATITTGTINNATLGTTTATAGTVTNLTAGTTTSTAANITNGTIQTLTSSTATITGGTFSGSVNATSGTIGTLNSTTGTIGNLSTTLVGDLTISQGTATIGNNAITTAKINDSSVTPAKLSQPLTLAASVASTSGTAIDFTGIPSWAKRINVMFDGVSTNGSSMPIIQLGDSGGIETTGYVAGGSDFVSYEPRTAGIPVARSWANTFIVSGCVTLFLVDSASNTWVASGNLNDAGGFVVTSVGGKKATSATLDRLRVTTVNGTDTFDAGSINIMYEG